MVFNDYLFNRYLSHGCFDHAGLLAWERNNYGQFGLGNTQDYFTPEIVPSPPEFYR